jgi:hypothetical protein
MHAVQCSLSHQTQGRRLAGEEAKLLCSLAHKHLQPTDSDAALLPSLLQSQAGQMQS